MSYRTLRILAAIIAFAFAYIGTMSRIHELHHSYYPLFLLCGFQVLVALGLGTVRDSFGWHLRFGPIALCLLFDGAFFMWDQWPLSLSEVTEELVVLPVIWLMLTAIFDLSGQPATNAMLRGFRRTANLLRSPLLLIVGSSAVICSIVFGKKSQEWITASEYVSWHAELPTAIRNYAGLAVFFAILFAAGLTLLVMAVRLVKRNLIPSRLLKVAGFMVFLLCAYAAIDAGFAAFGLLIGDISGAREIYIAWVLFEVVALSFLSSDFSSFGHVRRQTMMGLGLLIAPQLQLALQICIGSLSEDGWLRTDSFVTFYPGVGLLLWGFARMVLESPAVQPVTTIEDQQLKAMAATA